MEFHDCYISESAIELATQVLRSGRVSNGAIAKSFERALALEMGIAGSGRVVALNSGTSALHLALEVIGVRGKEVILPAQTFVASGLAILMAGGKPVFADIDLHTGNIEPESVKEHVTENTAAIMVVDWAGNPARVRELRDCNLPIVQDAAHSFGARYSRHDLPVGTYSDYTCLSFQAIKSLTTGDGGALVCIDPQKARLARRLSWFGIDRENDQPNELGERQYSLDRVGFKYHMSDLSAALGIGNLVTHEIRLNVRRNIADTYDCLLRGMVIESVCDTNNYSAYWLYPVRVERRDEFVRAMKSRGIPVSVVHQRIDRHPVFGGPFDLPNQAEFDRTQVHLPIHARMTIEDVEHVAHAVKAGW